MREVETGTGCEVVVRWLRLTERLFRYSGMQRLNIVGIPLTFGVLRALLDAQFPRHLNSLSFTPLDDAKHAM